MTTRKLLRKCSCTVLVFLLFAGRSSVVWAGDWPQILGPHRNGIANDERLLEKWPAGGPRELWSRPVGEGYSGAVVVGQTAVIFHRLDDTERVEAIDVANGQRIWKADFEATYRGGINSDLGPRCTPVLDKATDRVFVYGAAGDVHCVALSNGKKLWSRNVRQQYDASDGYFGAGSSPILAGGNLLINVGGDTSGAGIVALAADSGKVTWKATDELASYSSPTLMKVKDQTCVVFLTRLNAICVKPSDGKTVLQFPFGRTGPTVNAATPIVFDSHLFVTASYGIGAKLVKIDGGSVKPVWANDEVLSSQYATCVYSDGYFYGTDGREDAGYSRLRCVEARTGKVKWSVDRYSVAHVIIADEKLLIQRVDGELVLAKATPTQFEQLASASIFKATTRAIPALANGRLLVRSSSGTGDQLKCMQLGR